MEYALIKNNVFSGINNFDSPPENIPHKNVVWLPVEYEDAVYDSRFQRLGQQKHRIEPTKVILFWEIETVPESEYANSIQQHIDSTAQIRQYSDGISLASYDSSTNPAWAAEAQTFVAWRDAVWVYAFTELEKVKAGTRPQPSIDELLAELPVISWP